MLGVGQQGIVLVTRHDETGVAQHAIRAEHGEVIVHVNWFPSL